MTGNMNPFYACVYFGQLIVFFGNFPSLVRLFHARNLSNLTWTYLYLYINL